MTTRRAHPAVTFFGTLISRSFSFVCVVSQFIFSLSVQDSFFVYRFTFSFLSRFTFGFFRVFFGRNCASHFWGRWNNTRWPLSFLSFSFFSSPFPSIPLFFFSARVTVRQSQFRFPFVPVTCRKVIFFSSFPQPSSLCSWCSTF
jgi:hypothetical protein